MIEEIQNPRAAERPEIKDPAAAEMSESGHWAETQVIQSLKDANLRHKDPRRVLRGEATQEIGGIFHPVKGEEGELITPKPSLRARVKRIFSYFKG